jgi:glycosyltransferase involved in cell wall biosynthesis
LDLIIEVVGRSGIQKYQSRTLMKIALVSSVAPFVNGGYRNIVNWLGPELLKAGHEVETIWLPFDDSIDQILPQMINYRFMRLEESCDRIVTFRPPAHLISHPDKICWFIHHQRIFYDLWGTQYSPLPETPRWQSIRAHIVSADTHGLREASAVFSNSQVVADRLRRYNGISSQVLYPPIANPERFFNETWGSELVFICRIERHKRQHLAIEAMKHVKTPVRLRVCGMSGDSRYLESLVELIRTECLEDRVTLDNRWISEGEKAHLLAIALANVYLPADEDSYGYPTLEAAHSSKATISTEDAGGVREFVVDEETGIITAASPLALAEIFDRLYLDRALAERLGTEAKKRISDLKIDWQHVTDAITNVNLSASPQA